MVEITKYNPYLYNHFEISLLIITTTFCFREKLKFFSEISGCGSFFLDPVAEWDRTFQFLKKWRLGIKNIRFLYETCSQNKKPKENTKAVTVKMIYCTCI